MILNTPHNPTGKVFTRQELEVVVQLCVKYDVYIITDEIYEHMTYAKDKKHVILPQVFPSIANKTFLCNSAGKSASATGWRFGWCIHPVSYSEQYRGINDQLVVMSPHPMQFAAKTYLSSLPVNYFQETLAERYLERIQILAHTLKSVGFKVSQPEGAYYLFARYREVAKLQELEPMDAAMFLLERVGVACVPGDNFYGSESAKEAKEYLRFAACRSMEDVKEACMRLMCLKE